ncbi:macoilin-like [Strongylocentrotus purpuratus]|uniref:Macoilin n=1 Tax=Strongylocentrotus purpuratus TaxID=7668 RepID=A0A7M7T3H8_STRPU|nr:macoilin-like [Strongylocentrotus purpuratus]
MHSGRTLCTAQQPDFFRSGESYFLKYLPILSEFVVISHKLGAIGNMKRRTADCGRPRRPLKRTKITEGIYGSSTFLYLKFLGIWGFVLLLDFLLEFRFEYLWPVWLLLRSIYDSYKYQGLAFSVFFIFIAFTSDMICLLFIPVHWLFFAASTYVWVQFVWHTDRGICLPTVALWLLFVYIEASVRLRGLRSVVPFHLDLCRPFAAHCIGYPVVTLGFNFKSYVSYRMRLRKQKEVQKENDFYMQLLQQALPPEQQAANGVAVAPAEKPTKAVSKKPDEPVANGVGGKKESPSSKQPKNHPAGDGGGGGGNERSNVTKDSRNKHVGANNASTHAKSTSTTPQDGNYIETKTSQLSSSSSSSSTSSSSSSSSSTSTTSSHSVNEFDNVKENLANEQTQAKNLKQISVGSSTRQRNPSPVMKENSSSGQGSRKPKPLPSKLENKDKDKDTNVSAEQARTMNSTNQQVKTDPSKYTIARLESDIKKLKADLQASRQVESDLRNQVNSILADEIQDKEVMEQYRKDNESLQNRLHNLVTQKQQDKQNIIQLEKKVKQERDGRTSLENLLKEERKSRKAEESCRQYSHASSVEECTENCRTRRQDQESEIQHLLKETRDKGDRLRDLEQNIELRERQEIQSNNERLMNALVAMQDKTAQLENSLRAETKLKLDLFSALGDARRQVEIAASQLHHKDSEIRELKSTIADLMAVMPMANYPSTSTSGSAPATPRYSVNFCSPRQSQADESSKPAAVTKPMAGVSPLVQQQPTPPPQPQQPQQQRSNPGTPPPGAQSQGTSPAKSSGLDPNAAIYRPKSN